ncbi:MAG: hydroxyacid dehydrogenase [Candidatus Aenigmarchaeota archaeon]|nr:hydroxyacid dehydrogenase [Candidatus Aenigmarchaeota archaeon]
MKVLVVSPNYFPEDILSEFDGVADVVCRDMSREELLNEIGNYDAVLTRVDTTFDKHVLEKATRLKVIGTSTTGLDHIDVEDAIARGIKIFNLSGTHTVPAAELTFSLILSLVRKIPGAHSSLSSGKWNRHEFVGTELEGKTLGIIGFGRIGSRIGEYAKVFGMKIIAYDPYVDKSIVEKIGVKMVTLDDLFHNSDVITLHSFLSPETRDMINSSSISKMKKNAFLVNVSRGELVNDDDLLDALNEGKIAGAALDVFTEEPLPSNSKLTEYARTHDNLILTPHIGASTKEAVIKSAKEIVHNVKEFLVNKRSD